MDIRLTIDGQPVDATLNAAPPPATSPRCSRSPWNSRTSTGPRRSSTFLVSCPPPARPKGAAPKAGDLAYYAPWGNLVLYYTRWPFCIEVSSSSATSPTRDRLTASYRTPTAIGIEAAS